MQYDHVPDEELYYITQWECILHWNEVCYLVNLSTTTMIESCCLTVLRKRVIKSIEMSSHFHYGIRLDCSKPPGFLHSAFTLTIQASSHKLCHFFIQVQPIIKLIHCCQCLLISQVTWIQICMKLLQDSLLELTIIRHIDPVPKSDQTICHKTIFHILITCTLL